MMIPDWVFLAFNFVLIITLLFCMAFGWQQGGKHMLADIVRTVLQIAVTVFVTYFLTTHYSLFNEQKFYAYMEGLRNASGTPQPYSPLEVNKFRFYRSGIIWFFVALVGVGLLFGIIRHFYRKLHKNSEKKPIRKADRVLGEILGGVLFLFWITLFTPVMISTEKADVFINGSDLVSRTVLKYPVNYIAKPLAKLILGDNPAAMVFDDGLEAITQGVEGFAGWIEEHCDDVTEVADLTQLFIIEEQTKNSQ